MKSLWRIAVPTGCVILIFAVPASWYFVRTRVNERRLSQEAIAVHKRAEQGDVSAETELGHIYYRGLGLKRDYAKAFAWFHKAANHGQAKAQYDLGYMYWYGQGVPENKTAAVEWYRNAAEQGYAQAQDALGSSYYYGQGVQQDRAKAACWYRKAADHGLAAAKYDLGYMLYYGEGIAQNRAQADRLLHQAADQGNENARRALHLARRTPGTWNKITLLVIFVGSLLLLIGSLFSRKQLRGSEVRVTALAGFFGLVYSGLDFERYFRYGIPPFSSAETIQTILYFTWASIGGASLAMSFIIILSRKRAKTIIVISCLLFAVFNLIAFGRSSLSNQIPTIRILLSGLGWFIGMVITLAAFLWMGRRRGGGIAKPEKLAR